MRTLFIAVALIVATAALAQQPQVSQTDQKYTVAVDTSKMNVPQQMEQIMQVLERHGGGPLERVYKAAYRKQVGILFMLLTFAVGFMYWGTSWKIQVKRERNDPNSPISKDNLDGYALLAGLLVVVSVVLFLTAAYRWIAIDYLTISDIARTVLSMAGRPAA